MKTRIQNILTVLLVVLSIPVVGSAQTYIAKTNINLVNGRYYVNAVPDSVGMSPDKKIVYLKTAASKWLVEGVDTLIEGRKRNSITPSGRKKTQFMQRGQQAKSFTVTSHIYNPIRPSIIESTTIETFRFTGETVFLTKKLINYLTGEEWTVESKYQ